MSFDTKWDVDQYKTEHESDEHWELKRSFMIAHKDKFPEERLVCLAQVFTNVEFLGCRYPAETMQLVAHLSKGVADSYREKQKNRLQRTFVQASDAAGAKAKGLKRPAQEETATGSTSSQSNSQSSAPSKRLPIQADKPSQQNTSNSQLTSVPKVTYGPPLFPEPQKSIYSSQSSASSNGSSRFSNSRYGGVKTYHVGQSSAGKSQNTEMITTGPYGKLVLIEPAYESMSANQIINTSAGACRVYMECKYEAGPQNSQTCKVFLNKVFLAEATAEGRKFASKLACEKGLKKLKEIYYTVKVKIKTLSDTTIDKSLNIDNSSSSKAQSSSTDTPLDDNNIGNRLLRLMGWSGGGLGKDQQGIAEPVRVQEHVSRGGLGLSKKGGKKQALTEKALINQKVRQMIQDYANSDSQYDLVFSTEFTKAERKAMHQIATRYKLKTKSYGKAHDRYLVISKKQDIWQTMEQLFENGGSTERYELIAPTGEQTEPTDAQTD